MSYELDDELVLGATIRIIEAARQLVPFYAGTFSPMHTAHVSELLKRSTCFLSIRPFRSDAVAFTLPPIRGRYIIAVNRDARRTDRQFAIRHEVAHVLAGDVEEAIFLSERGYQSHPERVADLFALADLVPGWFIDQLRSGQMSWGAILAEVRGAIRAYAEEWPCDRLEDRARLRLRLYRECGI